MIRANRERYSTVLITKDQLEEWMSHREGEYGLYRLDCAIAYAIIE
jgi:hypothetical protein